MKLTNTKKAVRKFAIAVIKSAQTNLVNSKMRKSALINNMQYQLIHRKMGGVVELVDFTFGNSEDYWYFVDQGVRGKGGYKPGRGARKGKRGGTGMARGGKSKFKFKKNNIKRGVIQKWIKRKGVKLRGVKGKFINKTAKNIRNAAFVIGRAIALRGLPRTLFFTKAFDTQYKAHINKITNAYAEDVAQDAANKMKKHKD